jgi:hypothetical protein
MLRLNSWIVRNNECGFGLVPNYSKRLAIYVRQSLTGKEGFSLGKAITSSPAIVFFDEVEDEKMVLIGTVYIMALTIGSRKAGVIGGQFTPGMVNTGAEILDPFKPIPIPEWYFWSKDRLGRQRTVSIRWK